MATLHQRVTKLRKEMTPAECYLWQALRNRGLGVRFRRQFPIGCYVVDFACLPHRLVVEVDGGQHLDNARDRERDTWIHQHGYRVLRFWNNEVLPNRPGVLARIIEVLSGRDG